ARHEARRGAEPSEPGEFIPHPLARVALGVDAFPVSGGNAVTLYHDTNQAYEELLAAVAAAKRHVHLQFYIFRDGKAGRRLVDVLAGRARAGVEVRVLFDSVGSFFLSRRLIQRILEAGGKACSFLPVNPLRSWIQVNLRNHRKMVIIDGELAITG